MAEIYFPTKKKDLSIKTAGDEIVVYDIELKKVHVINEIAEKVLAYCDGTHSVDQIVEAIKTDYLTMEGQDIRSDIIEIINKYKEMELIKT